MPRFAANLTMMFNEWPFLDRFSAAADAGFSAVEFLFPYAYRPDDVARRLERNSLTLALFNLPAGNWEAGERGLAALPARFDELCEATEFALDYVAATGVRQVHLMAGLADAADTASMAAYRRSVATTAERLSKVGADLLIEPINGRDMPGYFLQSFMVGEKVIRELGLPNLKLQFDIYHRQILHGDVATALKRVMPIVGHIQVASVPSRNEPDGEEINYPFLFEMIDASGYAGFVGCEYRPRAKTLEGLDWLARYSGGER